MCNQIIKSRFINLLFIIGLYLFVTSCSSPEERAAQNNVADSIGIVAQKNTSSAAEVIDDEVNKGKLLALKLDCVGCHNQSQNLVGPSYKAIAIKYKNNEENINYLAAKIIKGGKGVWGEVPMNPHPQISLVEAKQIVNYILTIK